jgi:predicted ribosome quality control (RQC) complex YloA/Tae2 family protein
MTNRKFVLPAAELLDRLSVDQIKEMLFDNNSSITKEIDSLSHDIDLILSQKDVKLNARFIRIIMVLSQINVHIWYLKDKMQEDDERYDELLKLAHQINGVRNRMKNLLLEEFGDKEKSLLRSNFDTDGLKGWEPSI